VKGHFTHVRRFGDDQIEATPKRRIEFAEPVRGDEGHRVELNACGAFSRESASASGETSSATSDARNPRFPSSASRLRPIAPEPHPTSSSRGSRRRSSRAPSRRRRPVPRIRTRDKNAFVQVEVEGTKRPVSEYVLQGFAAQATLLCRFERDGVVIELFDQPPGLSPVQSRAGALGDENWLTSVTLSQVGALACRPTRRPRKDRDHRRGLHPRVVRQVMRCR